MFAFSPPRTSLCLLIGILTTVAILFSVLAVTTVRAAPNAPTFTVNSTLDAVDAHPGDGTCATSGNLCTLRAAIMEANHTPGGGATINVPAGPTSYKVAIPPAGTDDETTGDLNLTANMSIVGKASHLYSTVIIDAATVHDRVFHINSGVVNISNLSSITNGQSADNGGGIYNQGLLNLINTTVISNTSSSFGAGIANDGTATLTHSTVSSNHLQGTGSGGGIFNIGTVFLDDSTVTHNVAVNSGGIQNQGTLVLADSTVSANNALDAAGVFNSKQATIVGSVISINTADNTAGGIHNQGVLTMTNSTLSGNTTNTSDGGGLLNEGKATLTNDTLSGNTTANRGGGIYNDYGALTLTNSTVSGNTAAFSGSEISNFHGSGTLIFVTLGENSGPGGNSIDQFGTIYTETLALANTIVAGSSTGINCEYFGIPLFSEGYNLSSDGTCPFTSIGDLQNTNPKLGPLANNGGSTQTLALLSGSPALDKIPSASNGCDAGIYTDQRGSPRPVNGKCDIGAYESNSPLPPATPTRTATPKPTLTPTPCTGKPPAATLLKPTNGKQVGKARAVLVWSAVACATKYKVVVDVGKTQGVRVDHKKEAGTRYKTTPLPGGKPYYWRVKACDAAGCTNSPWFEFTRT